MSKNPSRAARRRAGQRSAFIPNAPNPLIPFAIVADTLRRIAQRRQDQAKAELEAVKLRASIMFTKAKRSAQQAQRALIQAMNKLDQKKIQNQVKDPILSCVPTRIPDPEISEETPCEALPTELAHLAKALDQPCELCLGSGDNPKERDAACHRCMGTGTEPQTGLPS